MAIFPEVDTQATPSKPSKPPDKEPGILSLRSSSLLEALENASPASSGLVLRAMNQGDLQRQRTERGLDIFRRRAEADALAASEDGSKPLEILSKFEWAKRAVPGFTEKKRRTQRDEKRLNAGYTAYLGMLEFRQKQALQQAKLGTEVARTAALERSQQPSNATELLIWQLQHGKPLDQTAVRMHDAQHSKLPGLRSTEGIAARALTSTETRAGLERERKVSKAELDRALKVSEAVLDRAEGVKGKAAKPLLTPAKVNNVVISAKTVGKLGKDKERLTFDDWMYNQYLPIARSTTPEQRAKVAQGLGDKLPSAEGLIGMLVVPPSTERGLIFKETVPPTRKAIEGGFDTLDFVVEGLRLHGADDQRIARLRAMFEGKLLDARGRNGN